MYMNLNRLHLLFALLPMLAFAEDTIITDDLILEDIGETIDNSELELDQLSTPDLPAAVMPDMFREINSEIVSDNNPSTSDETKANDQAKQPIPENVKVNVIEVRETFYKLTLNPETNAYTRAETTEAKPGDLIELVIRATNEADETVENIEMVNNVPSGPVQLIEGSFATDLNNSLYRLSRNGKDFFPSDAEIEPQAIRHIQWLIFSLAPQQSMEFKYRIRINQ